MKTNLTRLFAPLLALVMVFTAFPVYAFADELAEEPAVAAEVITEEVEDAPEALSAEEIESEAVLTEEQGTPAPEAEEVLAEEPEALAEEAPETEELAPLAAEATEALAAEAPEAEELAPLAPEAPETEELAPLAAGNQFWIDGVAYDASKEHTSSKWNYEYYDDYSYLTFTNATVKSIKIDCPNVELNFYGKNSIGRIELPENNYIDISVGSDSSVKVTEGIYGKGSNLYLYMWGDLTVTGASGSSAAPAILLESSDEMEANLSIYQTESATMNLTGGIYTDGSQAEAISVSQLYVFGGFHFIAKGGNAISANVCKIYGSGGYCGVISLQGGRSPEGTGYCIKKLNSDYIYEYDDAFSIDGSFDIALISGNENEPIVQPDVNLYVAPSSTLIKTVDTPDGSHHKEFYEPKKFKIALYDPLDDTTYIYDVYYETRIEALNYFTHEGYMQVAWSDGLEEYETVWGGYDDESTVFTAVYKPLDEYMDSQFQGVWNDLKEMYADVSENFVIAKNGNGISHSFYWGTAAQLSALNKAYSEAEAAMNGAADSNTKRKALDNLERKLNDVWQIGWAWPAVSIDIPAPYAELLVKKSAQLEAIGYDEEGDVSNEIFTWSSSDPSVAKVDAKGKLTGVSAGTATITVSGSQASGSFYITVIQPISGLKLAKTKETLVVGGSDIEIPIIITDKTGKAEPYYEFLYDEDYVSVGLADDNVLSISPKNMPTNKTVVTVKDYYSGKSAKITLKIGAPANCVTTTMKSTDLQVFAGKTLSLKAAGAVEGTSIKPINTSVVWSSSDESIAAVDAKGKVKAIGCGKCQITASVPEAYGTGSLTFEVTVLPVLKSVMFADKNGKKLTKTTAVAGQKLELAEIVDPMIDWVGGEPDGSMYEVSIFTTAKPAVAELNGTVLTCNAKGSAAIKLVVVCGNKKKQASLTVKIDAPK